MRTVTGRHSAVIRLILLLLVLALALLPAACGGDDTPGTDSTASTAAVSTTTAAVTTSVAVDTTSSAPATSAPATPATSGATTAVPAVATIAGGATTTVGASTTASTAKATTTTAKATTTTAKATTTTAKPTTTTAAPTSTTAAAGPIVLKLSGPSGSQTFTMAQLKALPSISGYGGWKNQNGVITAPMSWKGVTLSSLMKLVGGGSYCNVVASDGYTSTVTPGSSMGMYDPATGDSLEGIKVTAILAYSKNGGGLGGDEGPLRIAFVSPEKNQVTDGSQWARMVVEIKVK